MNGHDNGDSEMDPVNGKASDHEAHNGSHSGGRGGDHSGRGGEESLFRREELVRLMLQSLQSLGLVKTAKLLQQESGFMLETPVVTKFRQGILEGNWEMVKRKLFLLLKDLYYFDALLFLMNFDFRFTRRYWSWASMIRCTLGFGVPLIFWWKGRAGSLFLQSDQFCLALILAHQVSHWAAEIP